MSNDFVGTQAEGPKLPRRRMLAGSAGLAAGTAAVLGSSAIAHASPAGGSGDAGSPNLGPAAPRRASAVPSRRTRIGIGYETWWPGHGWERPEAEPVLGHYDSSDPNVILQHARWLTWSGFDHLCVDWSNNLGGAWTSGRADQIMGATDKLLEIYVQHKIKLQLYLLLGLDGGKVGTPHFVAEVDRIKSKYLNDPRYRPFFVEHDGKPLLTIFTGARTTEPPDWSDDTFTVRYMGAFREIVLNPGGVWSWVDRVAYANGQTAAVHPFSKTDWNGWTADGDWKVETLAAQPAFNKVVATDVAWNKPAQGAAQSTGSLTSPAFTISDRSLAFDSVGFDMQAGSDLETTDGRNVFLLKDAVSGKVLRHAVPPGDSTRLYVRQWNVADLVGRKVVFQVSSKSSAGGGLGWLGLDGLWQQRSEQMTACVSNGGNEAPGGYAN
ncbi:hypothetical protein SAMN05421678_13120 [Actinopolymorpha cephalotaxi]|uniref:Uncharacterized protein n=1 Tax=Actinopolymorpha cephalotaxi TaxID=504797 RepID=A0A1I3CB83_9ACTN|nr:hypothetical protein [Actinopolymorpha cephalotaxi]NYH86724.1 hypothetical protein [Actinopolymorpha cephalotaxi]SFH71810.1 hypothetical protein SAMN05421678_13120 [Actinopolymorpha cephalotaxi]